MRRRAEKFVNRMQIIENIRDQLQNFEANNEVDGGNNSENNIDLISENSDNFENAIDSEESITYDHDDNDDDFGNNGMDINGSGFSETDSLNDYSSDQDNQNIDDFSMDDEGIEENNDNLRQEEVEDYVIESIRDWALNPGILSMTKLDDLLARLSQVFKNMPKSYKTLLNTPNIVNLKHYENHQFWYKGIKKILDQMLLDNYLNKNHCIKIDVNVDGLPLFRNSKKKFWPILCRLAESLSDPFIIAIYFGKTDPKDVDLFLGDFILEIEELRNNGYYYKDIQYSFSIRHFILDAPARSLVKCCIYHGGYGACERCSIHGGYDVNRVHYATINENCYLRTDQNFVDQLDKLHHTGRSPLEFVGIGMVSQFRLEGMHLIHGGVFKRFLEVITDWPGDWRLTDDKIKQISVVLSQAKQTCPDDFNRKPRDFEEWSGYKATELRRLLLYDGMVVFKDQLDENIYKQFLLLHCGTYILTSTYLQPILCEEAKIMYDEFVNHCIETYGNHFVSYNVHSLKHFAEECQTHGSIDSFSAFPFENALKTIKEALRSGYKPLHQIAKRDSENRNKINVNISEQNNSVKLFQKHVDLLETEEGDHFKKAEINGIVIKIDMKNSCLMTQEGEVFVLQNIVRRNNSIILTGNMFQQKDDFYTYPLNSSTIGIMKVWNISEARQVFHLENIIAKCWLIEQDDFFVSIPLLHTVPLIH